MRGQSACHTWQTGDLADEAILRLIRAAGEVPRTPGELILYLGQVMRRLLVDHAREKAARRAPGKRVGLDDLVERLEERGTGDLERLDHLLRELEATGARGARQCAVVSLRFFCLLSEKETANALGISLRSVQQDLALARSWLRDRLRAPVHGSGAKLQRGSADSDARS